MTRSSLLPVDFVEGLEGVVAFATEIAEPDRDGGALRSRGVDIEALAGRVPLEQGWGLLAGRAAAPARPRSRTRSITARATRAWTSRPHSRSSRPSGGCAS